VKVVIKSDFDNIKDYENRRSGKKMVQQMGGRRFSDFILELKEFIVKKN
jgi:hypothetical protein